MAAPKIAFNYTIREGRNRRVDLENDTSGELQLADLLKHLKTTLILVSDQVLREEQAKGFDEFPIMLVDNNPRKPISQVSPFGKVEFRARVNIKEALLDIYKGLLHRSKVLTGAYRDSHYVFLNGMQVATNQQSLEAWLNTNPTIKDKDKIRFVNIQPYARKLERYGITAQRSHTKTKKTRKRKGVPQSGGAILAPNGAYQLTARSAKSKYGKNVFIRFVFLPGSTMGLSGVFKTGKKSSAGRPYLYPTISVSVSSRGVIDV